ncbi:hypothetical protein [Sphingomonas pituitosa]|uniref:hypothetical protein n=1 Tax=Sphingomonas pituitosa TaxID=99597 RepID=UPI001C3F5C76
MLLRSEPFDTPHRQEIESVADPYYPYAMSDQSAGSPTRVEPPYAALGRFDYKTLLAVPKDANDFVLRSNGHRLSDLIENDVKRQALTA